MDKITIRDIARHLKDDWDIIKIRQQQIITALPDKDAMRVSLNRKPCGGWCVPGRAAWTQAVKQSGLPWAQYWSGKAPTPSTQYPLAVAEYIERLTGSGDYYRKQVDKILAA